MKVGDSGGPSKEEVLELLANEQRRRILLYLLNCDENRVRFDDLIDHLQSQKQVTEENQSVNNRQQILIECYHIHIPKLTDYELIEYDTSTRQIWYTDDSKIEQLRSLISEASVNE